MVEVLAVDPKFEVFWDARDRGNVFAYRFAEMFTEGHQFDVTLFAENKPLYAHRRVLSFFSVYFKAVFDKWSIQKRDLVLMNVPFNAMQKLLAFIYYGEVRVERVDVPAFLKAADSLEIALLQGIEEFVMKNIHPTLPSEFDNNRRGDVLADGFQALFEKKKHFDVTLVVKGKRGQKRIKAHRSVLSVCSEYFRDLLNCVSANQLTEVVLEDSDSRSITNLLHYMYFGKVIVNDMIELVLNAGEHFKVAGLERADDLEAERQPGLPTKVFRIFANSKLEFDHRQYEKFVGTPIEDQTSVTKSGKSSKIRAIPESDEEEQPNGVGSHGLSDDSSEDDKPSFRRTRSAVKNKKNKGVRQPNPNVPKHKLKKARKNAKKAHGSLARAKHSASGWAEGEQNVTASGAVKERDHDEDHDKADAGLEISLSRNEVEQIVAAEEHGFSEDESLVYDNELDEQVDEPVEEQEEGAVGGQDVYDDAGCWTDGYANEHDTEPSAYESEISNGFEAQASSKYHQNTDGNNNHCDPYSYMSDSEANEAVYMGYYRKSASDDERDEDWLPENDYADVEQQEEVDTAGGWNDEYEDIAQFVESEEIQVKPRTKGKSGGPGKPKAFNVQVEITKTSRGAECITYDGYSFRRISKQKDCYRWICSKNGGHSRCAVYSFTKEIDGVLMASFAPISEHTHGPEL